MLIRRGFGRVGRCSRWGGLCERCVTPILRDCYSRMDGCSAENTRWSLHWTLSFSPSIRLFGRIHIVHDSFSGSSSLIGYCIISWSVVRLDHPSISLCFYPFQCSCLGLSSSSHTSIFFGPLSLYSSLRFVVHLLFFRLYYCTVSFFSDSVVFSFMIGFSFSYMYFCDISHS